MSDENGAYRDVERIRDLLALCRQYLDTDEGSGRIEAATWQLAQAVEILAVRLRP